MKATDTDQGNNARITYEISGPANHRNVFRIDPNTGIVRTSQQLDYETLEKYELTLTAYDSGNPRRSGTTRLNIVLIDVNEPPRFTGPGCAIDGTCLFRTTEEQKPGVRITSVTADDPDKRQNCQLLYSLSSLDKQYFNIDKTSGMTILFSNFIMHYF